MRRTLPWMPARVPLDVDLEDRLLYGLTPIRLAYAVGALLAAFALWSSPWGPAAGAHCGGPPRRRPQSERSEQGPDSVGEPDGSQAVEQPVLEIDVEGHACRHPGQRTAHASRKEPRLLM